ncbi:methyl-accepting chemotaxis protein [Paenibacillus athensensis]|uniref:methyl-accepting chemotaxis protein n=1 Tax=Paenibacillus athensensis TaxID=1967502 RepID=UPI001070224F|nr:methyl-accepting chemotaxis protein [Paenibacillus athensensis]MCD1258361.1 methyl-accepting chemotaxis protein [Paenibacillus athensensis]
MKLKTRVIVCFTASIVLMMIAGAVAMVSNHQMRTHYESIVQKDENVRFLLKSIQFRLAGLSNDERGYLLTGDATFTGEMDSKRADIDSYLKTLAALPLSPEELKIKETIDANYSAYVQASELALQLYAQGAKAEAQQQHLGPERTARKALDPLITAYLQQQEQRLNGDVASIEREASRSNYVLEGLMALTLIAGVAMGFVLLRSLRPLTGINRQLKEIAEGSADLTREIVVKSKDEIRQLADSFNAMLRNLRGVIGEAQGSALHVASSAEQLAAGALQVRRSAEQIAARSQMLAEGAEQQLAETEQSADIIGRMNEGLGQLGASSRDVKRLAGDASEAASQGGEALVEALERMEDADRYVQSGFTLVQKLSSRSEEIGGIAGMIQGLANQTNLLALNAAIEAARAGESGRGFQVVAQEVRKLAEQSLLSAGQISELIEEVRQATAEAVEAMQLGSGEVRTSVGQTRRVNDIFEGLQALFGEVSGKIGEVSDSIALLGEGSGLIGRMSQELSGQAKAGAAASQEMSSSSQEQLASMEEMMTSIQSMADTADKLSALLREFKTGGR